MTSINSELEVEGYCCWTDSPPDGQTTEPHNPRLFFVKNAGINNVPFYFIVLQAIKLVYFHLFNTHYSSLTIKYQVL